MQGSSEELGDLASYCVSPKDITAVVVENIEARRL